MSKSKQPNVQDTMADIYAPPDKRKRPEHVVDVVCRIMDEDELGPRPMRNLRPAQKHRNAAEQFTADHLGVYDAHAHSRDRMHAVRVHNSAYPRMQDELDRKRSTAKVTVTNAQLKNKKRVQPKKNTQISKYVKKNNGQRQTASRVTKPKCRQRRRRSPCLVKLGKLKTKGCQCSTCLSVKDKKSGTTNIPLILNLDQPKKMAQDIFTCRDMNSSKYLECAKDDSETSEYPDSKKSSKHTNPDTDASVSSYHTFASMEDEPMVSH